MSDYVYDELNRRVKAIFQGRYELQRRLGSGGMGMVFLVQANDIGRKKYALKVVEKASPENKGVDVYSEIRILKDLKHPNIINVYEALEDREYVYIVQEYIDGRTLAELRDNLSADSVIDEEAVKLWMSDIADALAYIHSKGIIHRDIKPGNIMVDSDGIAKLIDFGIARRASTLRKNRFGSTVGSAPYSPLERLQGDADGVQTDIYAYGASFYSLLRKKVPSVSGRDINTLRTNNKNIEPYYMNAYRSMIGDLAYIKDEGIRELIRCCVNVDPDKRVRDFNTVRYNLRSINQINAEYATKKRTNRIAYIGFAVMLVAGVLCTGFGVVQMRIDHIQKYDKYIEEANKAYNETDYDLSEVEAKKAIEFDPGFESGYIIKYRAETAAAFEMGNDDIYERIISESEDDSENLPSLNESLHAVTYIANAYYETDRFESAIKELEKLQNLKDEQLLLLGEALYKSGDMSGARETLEKMTGEVPQRFYLEGLIEEETNNAEAIALYEKALTFQNGEPGLNELRRKALTQIINLQVANGDVDAAIVRIKKAITEDPALSDSAKVNIMLMDCYYRNRNYVASISQADTVIGKFNSAGAYAVKCSSQIETGAYEEALDTISDWKQTYPDDVRPHVHRAMIYNRIAGNAKTDSERNKTYPKFIEAYEEEYKWLQDHNALTDDFYTLEEPYREAVKILKQMEA